MNAVRQLGLVGWLRVGGTVVLAAIAVLAALLASDVRSTRLALERGDAVYSVSPRSADWSPSLKLGGLSQSLLGTADDVALRRGLALYQRVEGQSETDSDELDLEGLRARAEQALQGPAGSPDPSVASQARTLIGILAFGAASHGGAGVNQTDAALSDFTDAVTADPSNTAAKYDLELLLRLTEARGSRSDTGPVNGFGSTGRYGAAGGSPGSGY